MRNVTILLLKNKKGKGIFRIKIYKTRQEEGDVFFKENDEERKLGRKTSGGIEKTCYIDIGVLIAL